MSGTTIREIQIQKAFTGIGRPAVEIVLRAESGKTAAGMRIDPSLEEKTVDPALGLLRQALPDALLGRSLASPKELDREIARLREEIPEAAPFLPSVSRAVWELGAEEQGRELCQWIGDNSALTGMLPMPMSGAVAAGLNFGTETDYEGKPWWGFVSTGFDDTDDAVNALWVVQRKWQDWIRDRFGIRISVHNGNVFYPENCFLSLESLCQGMSETIEEAGFGGKVGLFADLSAHKRFDPAAGVYRGVLAGRMTPEEHRKALSDLCRTYPLQILIDPMADDGSGTAEELEGLCPVVCTPEGDKGLVRDLFDAGTVTESIELSETAKNRGIPLIPAFSLSPGLRAMDYYTALEVTAAFRCGMADHANRALELSGLYGQRWIGSARKGKQK